MAGAMYKEPTPAQRAAAWEREDPAELRRAAAEWAALGYQDYANYLLARAEGRSVPFVARPF